MKNGKHVIKYFSIIFIAAVLFLCIWEIPLKATKIDVKVNGTNVSGNFTGTGSLVKGKNGIFTADEGWIFEGNINPDGGLQKGELTNFPIPLDWRERSTVYLPEFYTGSVEDSTLMDVYLK